MSTNNKNLEAIKREFDAIIAYEKSLNRIATKGLAIVTDDIVNYVGSNNICDIYNCSVKSDMIARAIVKSILLNRAE